MCGAPPNWLVTDLLKFVRSYYIIEPLQDFKPMRKPYDKNSESVKKMENETNFRNKRKMMVRDWLHYLVWFKRFKTAIYGKTKNAVTSEFSQYYNICCYFFVLLTFLLDVN